MVERVSSRADSLIRVLGDNGMLGHKEMRLDLTAAVGTPRSTVLCVKVEQSERRSRTAWTADLDGDLKVV